MKTIFLLALAPLAFAGVMAANAAPVDYKLPDETAALKPGPNLEVAQNNCTACHSSDYIKTQPMDASWNPAGYMRNVIETVHVMAA